MYTPRKLIETNNRTKLNKKRTIPIALKKIKYIPPAKTPANTMKDMIDNSNVFLYCLIRKSKIESSGLNSNFWLSVFVFKLLTEKLLFFNSIRFSFSYLIIK